MPDFTGQVFSAAALAITHAGLTLAPMKQAVAVVPAVAGANPNQPMRPVTLIGSVLSQSPAPGQRVDASTPIELTVAQ